MMNGDCIRSLLAASFCLAFSAMGLARADHDPKKDLVAAHASGPFDVKISPQPVAEQNAASGLGRMSIDKQYHGDLEATAKGEMLTASTETTDSGVYVAVERVTGTLQGHSGSFALHHTGVMTRGVPALKITVVPDSGTGQLVGLSGTMNIKIDNRKHFYEFDYSLPSK